MERTERVWLGVLVAVAVGVNAITLSPLVPWQRWLLHTKPSPSRQVHIRVADYAFQLPAAGIALKAGEYVEFLATSADVTYGLGVFRPDGTLVCQMQVLPGYENRLLWRFDAPGTYDLRSTEYSGPRHSQMFVAGAIQVMP